MNIQQLEYFLNICETGSITKSASLLYLTQPALSKSIASLEKEIGAPLFIKNNSGVKLTPGGELFMIFAQNTLTELAEIKHEIELLAQNSSKYINIGYTHSVDSLFMSRLCSNYY